MDDRLDAESAESAKRSVPVLAAVAAAVLIGVAVLVAVAVVNNGPRVWDTAAFCGSYADFQESPVPEVCLSFPAYLRRSLTHAPYTIPAALVAILSGGAVYRWMRDRPRGHF